MTERFDVIVVGLGAMGSAAAYHLCKRGHRVLGLDTHPRLHKEGSSHGRSRIIRQAYAEAPEYVPLVQRAYELWRELEEESGRTLLTVTGGLNMGRRDGAVVGGIIRSAQQHDLPYEKLFPEEVAARFPGFDLPDDLMAAFDPLAGILAPEECVAAHLNLAIESGAELHHEEPVRRWEAGEAGARVETEVRAYEADRLIVTAGPWAPELLSDIDLPLSVERVVNVHFDCPRPDLFGADRFPLYTLDVQEGSYYGFPLLPGQGVKIGRHDGGEVCTPHSIRRSIGREEIEVLRSVLDKYLPGAAGAVKWALTCMYTNTPDRNFVIDLHPEHDNVAFGCGFSGHGFKFASVLGEVLADLVVSGRTEHPIGFLSSSRFLEEAQRQ